MCEGSHYKNNESANKKHYRYDDLDMKKPINIISKHSDI